MQSKRPVYYATTNICTFRWKHELLSNFSSRRESFHAMTCSMRILKIFNVLNWILF